MREGILKKLRAKARPTDLPQPWHSRRDFADLLARFTTTLAGNKGTVLRASSLPAAVQTTLEVMAELRAERVIVNGDAPPVSWQAKAPGLDWTLTADDPPDLRAKAAAADVGISGARALLAETGSVVVGSGPGHSRLATLLPTTHIVLAPTHLLTADLFTWLAAHPDLTPANLTLISGPSKTADIEQTLTVGVHGPKRLIVCVYG